MSLILSPLQPGRLEADLRRSEAAAQVTCCNNFQSNLPTKLGRWVARAGRAKPPARLVAN